VTASIPIGGAFISAGAAAGAAGAGGAARAAGTAGVGGGSPPVANTSVL